MMWVDGVKEGLIISILLSISIIAGKMALVSLGLMVW
jgi:hypothetical protein